MVTSTSSSSPNPMVVEPGSSISSRNPPSHTSLVTSLPEASSSFNSCNSSRPVSQNSSRSEPPSPLESPSRATGTITPQHGVELSSLAPPVLDPPSLSVTPPANHTSSQNHPLRSVPPISPTNISNTRQQTGNNAISWVSSLPTKIHQRRWLENTIGVLGVAVAIWLGVRGYKLAVWQSWNDLRQTCATYKQTNISLGPRCTKILEGDPPGPPYWLRKWAPNLTSMNRIKMARRDIDEIGKGFSPNEYLRLNGAVNDTVEYDATALRYFNVPTSLIFIIMALAIGGLLLRKARGKSNGEEVFKSRVRSDHPTVHFTRHHDYGPETVSGQGVVIKQTPEDEHYPGEIRRRLRNSVASNNQDSQNKDRAAKGSWSLHNNSAETLVASTNESRVPSISLHDQSANKTHEDLIELDWNCHIKAFFKPSTSEFFHIAPWKHTHSEDDDSVKRKAAETYGTHRALGQMVAGGAEWAVGKSVDQKLTERLQREGASE